MKIIIKNLQKKIPIYPKRIKKAAFKALETEGIRKTGELTLCFMTDSQIRELNLFYLGRYAATDVIAFNITNSKNKMVADIAISTHTAWRNAKTLKTTPAYELYLYLVHGILHLLGYDDDTAKHRQIMQKKAQDILSKLKITCRIINAERRTPRTDKRKDAYP